ncbi:MAG: sigma-70 family RNA polymerase sigma factor [Actinomycetota bacterium]|jgi:RNA polymerase sigma-70 factor, ECF subfamily
MVMIQGESLGQRAGTLPPLDDPLVLPDAQDDDMLLARLRAGDETAFRALVDRHRPWLVRLCTRLLGRDAHAAEDAAQESLLKLHAAARRDARPLRVRPWLTVVARNTCIDEQRRRRPDLPGELPERAVSGDDPFSLDAALAEAWPRLSGRHREVLYLREVLGFSYKEIGSVMGLSLPAVETLVFRARAALRREYERAGGTAFGCGLFGFHFARMGLRPRRNPALSDSVSSAAVSDPGLSGLTSRLAQWMTSLPGCGEQAVAKMLSVAAGVVVATATVLPGIGPFGDAPAGATGGSSVAVRGSSMQSHQPVAAAWAGPSTGVGPTSLKSLLGNAVPTDWEPKRSRRESGPAAAPAGSGGASADPLGSLREAAQSPERPSWEAPTWEPPAWERPTLRRPVRDRSEEGPLRSILPDRRDVERPERPVHPLRSLLEAVPVLLDPLPIEPPPSEPAPVEPAPTDPVPAPSPLPERGSQPIRSTVQAVKETVEPLRDTPSSGDDGEVSPRPRRVSPAGDGNVADRDPTLLRRQDG